MFGDRFFPFMSKLSKSALAIAITVSAVEIGLAITVFSKIQGAFEVIVVSLLGYLYICVVEFSTDFENYKFSTSKELHDNFMRIRKMLGERTDIEVEEKLKEALAKRERIQSTDSINRLGHIIILGIISWNFIKTLFFS